MKSEALCDETFYKDLGALINKGREVGGKIRDSFRNVILRMNLTK